MTEPTTVLLACRTCERYVRYQARFQSDHCGRQITVNPRAYREHVRSPDHQRNLGRWGVDE